MRFLRIDVFVRDVLFKSCLNGGSSSTLACMLSAGDSSRLFDFVGSNYCGDGCEEESFDEEGFLVGRDRGSEQSSVFERVG